MFACCFGGRKKQQERQKQEEARIREALQNLRLVQEMLAKRAAHIRRQSTEKDEEILALDKRTHKERIRVLFARKQLYRQSAEKLEKLSLTLDRQLLDLENACVLRESVSALQRGVRATHNTLRLEDVEKVVEQARDEQQRLAEGFQEMLKGSSDTHQEYTDEDIEQELKELRNLERIDAPYTEYLRENEAQQRMNAAPSTLGLETINFTPACESRCDSHTMPLLLN